MADPIEVNYTPDGDDWAVSVKGRGQTLTGRAPGLIAARDRADQLVEKIAHDEQGHPTVVHLLNGDAVEFTTAYLTARLAKTEPAEEASEDAPETEPEEEAPAADAEEKPRPSPTPRPAPSPRKETETGQAEAEKTDEPAKSTS